MTQIVEVIPAGDGGIDPEDAALAVRLIACHARDAYDEELLLEACGLAPYRRATPSSYMYGRAEL